MPTPDELRTKLQADMPAAEIAVRDTKGTGDHFAVEVAAPEFKDLSRLDQHRKVYASLQEQLDDGSVHALSIKSSVLEDEPHDD